MANEFESIKQTIDRNINETDDLIESDVDETLIKIFDMFEKGLITHEEFDLKKAQLCNKTEDNSLSKPGHVRPLYCPNCGIKLNKMLISVQIAEIK